jgi:hypothetical protein
MLVRPYPTLLITTLAKRELLDRRLSFRANQIADVPRDACPHVCAVVQRLSLFLCGATPVLVFERLSLFLYALKPCALRVLARGQ